MHTFIKGIEYFLPEKRESNADLKIDNPDWIIDDIQVLDPSACGPSDVLFFNGFESE